MYRFTTIIIFILFSLHSFAQTQTKESKELYAQAIGLYYQAKYAECIPLFFKVDSIERRGKDDAQNSIEIDWVSSAYYKMGDEQKARQYSPFFSYQMPPVDRRLTTTSDSISELSFPFFQNRDFTKALESIRQAREVVLLELGGESRNSLECRCNEALVLLSLGEEQKALDMIKGLYAICSEAFGKDCLYQYAIMSRFIPMIGGRANTGLIEDLSAFLQNLLIENNIDSDDLKAYIASNHADSYLQIGKIDESLVYINKFLDCIASQYGRGSMKYIEQLFNLADVFLGFKRYDIAISFVEQAENLTQGNVSEYGDVIGMLYLKKSQILQAQGKNKEAEKYQLKAKKITEESSDGKLYLELYEKFAKISETVQNGGKIKKRDLDKIVDLCQNLESVVGRTDMGLSSFKIALAEALATIGDSRSLALVDEQMDVLVSCPQFEPLFGASLVYLLNNMYVKARIASSSAMQKLHSAMESRSDYLTAQKSDHLVDNGLLLVKRDRASLGSAYDTISYSKAMIRQDLLYAKLLIKEQQDSLDCPSFMVHLRHFLSTADRETNDVVMRDSVYNRYYNKFCTHFGEQSEQVQQLVEMNRKLRFEKDNYLIAWELENNSPGSSFFSNEKYEEALARYNAAYEEWKQNGGEDSFYMVEISRNIPTEVKEPDILEVRKSRRFKEAMSQCEVIIARQFNEYYGLKILSPLSTWCECADSLGVESEILPMLKKLSAYDYLLDETRVSLITLLFKYQNINVDDYTRLADSLMQNVDDSDIIIKKRNKVSIVKKTINPLQIVAASWINLLSMQTKAPALKGCIPDSVILNNLCNVVTEMKHNKNLQLEATALEFFIIKYKWKYRSELLHCSYDWDASAEMLQELREELVPLFRLIESNKELQNYSESYEILNILCSVTSHYKLRDEALTVRVDKIRKEIRQNCENALKNSHRAFSNIYNVSTIPCRISSLAESALPFQCMTDDEIQSLETSISLCYAYDDYAHMYEEITKSRDNIRQMQREGNHSDDELSEAVETLSKESASHLYTDSLTSLAYDIALFSKGYLLRSEQKVAKVIEQSGNRTVLKRYQQYLNIKQQLDNSSISPELAGMLRAEAKVLLIELRRDSKRFDDYAIGMESCWLDVQAQLDDDEIAIEYVYDGRNDYYLLAIKKGYTAPLILDIYNLEDKLCLLGDSVYLKDNSIISLWPDIAYKYVNGQMVFEHPLEGVKRIYFAPTGALHHLSMENLLTDNGQRMCERYEMHRLSSTREIITYKQQKQESTRQKAVLFGGVVYDFDDDDWKHVAQQNGNTENVSTVFRDVPVLTRGAVSSLDYLPGTLTEVTDINSIIESSNTASTLFTGKSSTEESFKKMSGTDATVLHIATHGYYQKNDSENESIINNSGTQDNRESNSMSRSGLFLAGASSILEGERIPHNVEDGILTAREISALDLTNISLVTLSACETGLGDISSEGVFGLQRGFKKAGANSILMSLWKVDDEATCKLMTEFYSNWITRKMTKHDALEAAKRTVRETPGWEDPQYWAAFILLDGLD